MIIFFTNLPDNAVCVEKTFEKEEEGKTSRKTGNI